MIKSLWPNEINVASNEVVSVMILKEQASLLGQQTQNLVIAKVDSDIISDYFYDIFYLVATAMHNYNFELFRIRRPIEQFYPIEIYSDTLDMDWRKITSEDEFLKVLADILSHQKTMKIIWSMLIQSGWSPEKKIPSQNVDFSEDENPF